jgi:putative ABC transport system ATP-binding protein
MAHGHRLAAVDVMPPALEARSLYRFYRAGDEETLALQGVSLTVTAGEFVAVTGPSGSGKSTLLACLAGMDDPDGGTVHIAGHRMSHQPERTKTRLRARLVGCLFQQDNLIAHLTVGQNIALAQRLAGRRRADHAALTTLGLEHCRRALPAELSGGEVARAGLAVALANRPAVLLADEPTGELDSTTEARVLTLLDDATKDGTAVVVASHSPAVAVAAGRLLRLDDGKERT